MPEGNHRKKNRQSATPSHRWTTIAICLAGTWNGLIVTRDSSEARGWLRAGFPRQLLQEGVVIGLATCERDGHGPFDGMTPLTFGSDRRDGLVLLNQTRQEYCIRSWR
jgi:hypothetical protein